MKDQEIKMQCLMAANGDLDKAKTFYEWISECPTHRPVGLPVGKAYQDWLKDGGAG